MRTETPATHNGARRRIVLVDFDWQDADLLPRLLRRPEISVRLVAGGDGEEAGTRVAEMCGLPCTVDLADLTREIFDLALVSERSPRRTQVEGLLLALGTPRATPDAFLDDEAGAGSDMPGIEAPLALHAAAFETSLGGQPCDTILRDALPDLAPDAPTTPQPVRPSGRRGVRIRSLDDFPSSEDRHQLEGALRILVADTGAGRAELHAGRKGDMKMVAEIGPDDALLKGLVDLAVELNLPQVIKQLSGPQEGKAWGAWPFQTTQHRGVLAAGGINPAEGWTTWERMVEDLRATWDEHDREMAAPAFPLVPDPAQGWLQPDDFRARLELAVERNHRDGLRFAVHRLGFADVPESVDVLCRLLPDQLRDTDCICRPSARVMLLLTAGASSSFSHLRRRLGSLWETAWREAVQPAPAAPITDERIELTGPEDAEGFLTAACLWLSVR